MWPRACMPDWRYPRHLKSTLGKALWHIFPPRNLTVEAAASSLSLCHTSPGLKLSVIFWFSIRQMSVFVLENRCWKVVLWKVTPSCQVLASSGRGPETAGNFRWSGPRNLDFPPAASNPSAHLLQVVVVRLHHGRGGERRAVVTRER